MISVDEALQRILSYVTLLEPEDKPALDALRRHIATKQGLADPNTLRFAPLVVLARPVI